MSGVSASTPSPFPLAPGESSPAGRRLIPLHKSSPGPSTRAKMCVLLGFLLASSVFLLWIHGRAFQAHPDALMGNNSDVLSATWVVSLAASFHGVGPYTWDLNPPHGAIFLPAGWVSSLLVSPLVAVLGPVNGYNIALLLLLAAGAAGLAFLVLEVSGRPLVAVVAGGLFLLQPANISLLHGGTLENVAFWSLFFGMACAISALRDHSLAKAAWAGGLLSLVPLEMPYGVAYAVLALPIVLSPHLYRLLSQSQGGKKLGRLLRWALLSAFPAVTLAGVVFFLADLEALRGRGLDTAARNAADLAGWADFASSGGFATTSLSPGAIPLEPFTLLACFLLGLAGLPRSLPWGLVALLAFGLAIGPLEQNQQVLEGAFGMPGRLIGEGFERLHSLLAGVFPFSYVRFSRRWLLVASMAGLCAGSIGLARVGSTRLLKRLPSWSLWVAGAIALVFTAISLEQRFHYRDYVPMLEVPAVDACAFIAASPHPGAVLLLPSSRGPGPAFESFAGIRGLKSFDRDWLQVLHGRAQNYRVETIPTIFSVWELEGKALQWVGQADRIAQQRYVKADITAESVWVAASALPQEGCRALKEAGYGFIMVDQNVYEGPWLEALEGLLAGCGWGAFESAKSFDDGVGIRVFTLEP